MDKHKTCSCTVATRLFDLCDECFNKAQQAGQDLVSKDRDNVHNFGNPFGTQRWHTEHDEFGNVIDVVRIV